nr:SusC/RagA family TonB-linked outer membrane protein [Draconibacterium mangrovi]
MVNSNAIDQSKFSSWDGTETDWYDVLFEPSPMQQHSISFQNGTNRGSIYASLNYMKNDGIVRGDEDIYKRISGTLNVEYDIKDWLTLSSSNIVTYNNRNQVAENSPYVSAIRPVLSLDPLTPNIYSANNLPSHMQGLVDNGYKLVQDDNGDYFSISDYLAGADDINPNILLYSGSTKSWDHFIQGNTALNLTPIKDLVITSRLGYRLESRNSSAYQSAYYATATRNQDSPSIESTVQSIQYYQLENFLNYTKSIDDHNLVLMAGSSYSSRTSNFVTAGGMGLQFDDELFAYPNYLSTDANSLIHEGDEILNKKLSFYGRLSYDYGNKYMLQASMRADAADLSILPEAKRWGYFPALSLGWTVSNEDWFIQDSKTISSLKLRASWGQNGSTAGLSNFAYSKVIMNDGAYSFDANNPAYISGSVPSSTGNSNLKWETSEQTDFGIDLRLFDNRLTFNTDYYIKKTKDLIVSGTTPTLTIGNTVSPVNAGNVENKGFEFGLGWRDQLGDFKYDISANLATLKNEVTYLDPSIDRIAGFNYNRSTVTAFEKGFPVWYFIGYQVDHIDPATGNPLYVAEDGSLTEAPSSADLTMIGSGIPDITYGLTINLSYKNFDLTVFGQGTQGNEIFSGLTKTDRPQTNRLATYYTNAWTSQNTNAQYARMDYQESYYWQSSAVVFDGSYFKIKQIQLGYNLPDSWLEKIKLSDVRLYTSLDNFFLFTKYPGLDPETSSDSTMGLGVDIGSYPSAKTAVFGLNVTF